MNKTLSVVTGAGGLIGSAMVEFLLSKGHKVKAFDNNQENVAANLPNDPNLKITLRDVREIKPDDFNGAEYVFHFAGMMDLVPSIEKPALYMDVNVQGTVQCLEAARQAKVRKFVYAASSSCYGDKPELPTREDAGIDCCHPYALSKYLGEQAVFHWHHVYKLPVNSIRIFNAYGPRLRGSGTYGAVFGVFLKQKLEGHPFTIVGDGTQGRDFVYSTDVADAFYRAALTDEAGQAYNIGGGQPRSVNDIVELLGGGDRVYLPKRPGEPNTTWADISKAKSELGWTPRVSFQQGVESVVTDIEAFRRIPLWTPKDIGKATKGWFDALGERP